MPIVFNKKDAAEADEKEKSRIQQKARKYGLFCLVQETGLEPA